MAEVLFFEKTGCAGNARQKALLIEAGHTVQASDLRHTAWTTSALLDFLAGLPVAQWFNRAAPAIKSGEIVPETLDQETALALLCHNPLLIRRPLLQVGNERRVGFDAAGINDWIGLKQIPAGNLEACQKPPAPTAPQLRVHYVQAGNGSAYPCHFGASSSGEHGCRST